MIRRPTFDGSESPSERLAAVLEYYDDQARFRTPIAPPAHATPTRGPCACGKSMICWIGGRPWCGDEQCLQGAQP